MEEQATEQGQTNKQNEGGRSSAWNEIDITYKGMETLGQESFENILIFNASVDTFFGGWTILAVFRCLALQLHLLVFIFFKQTNKQIFDTSSPISQMTFQPQLRKTEGFGCRYRINAQNTLGGGENGVNVRQTHPKTSLKT